MDRAWTLPALDAACLHLCVQGSVPEVSALRLWWWAENRCAWSALVLLLPSLEELWPRPDGFTVTLVGWWWAVTAMFTWPFSTVLLDMLKFLKVGSEVCRNSLRVLSLHLWPVRVPCLCFFPFSLLLLLLFCSRETTPLGNCLKPAQSGYLQLACAQCVLSVSCKRGAVWVELVVRKQKYSLMFITEEMEHLNAALCYTKYLYKREHCGSHRMGI